MRLKNLDNVGCDARFFFSRIALKGHLDLSRKPDDALKVENEKEMLLIRVNSLENELRKVKERIESIA